MLRKLCFICISLVLAGILAGIASAETFKLEDGQTLSGDVVSVNESGMIVRTADGKYSDRVPWSKFTQQDLKKLAKNPKLAVLVEPFLDVPLQAKPKKPAPKVQTPQRLGRPEVHSLFGSLFSSNLGLLILLSLYAANLYAALEVSIYRARPRLLLCGLAAIPVLGFLVPIVFLCMPTRIQPVEEVAPDVAVSAPTFSVPNPDSEAAEEASAGPAAGGLRLSSHGGRTGRLPATQVFQRGVYTFNRRFFETKFPGFFAMVRREAEKDMVLAFKSARGQYVGQRISRITANELHLHVQKGAASEEIMIPFAEIQEVQLKHKDAP